jgi:hypothetical protein
MRIWFRNLASLALAAAVASPVLMTGCAVHARVYDPYYRDYHAWSVETPYDEQWERDSHRDHRDFNKRNSDEQKEYWDWRHKQGDHH